MITNDYRIVIPLKLAQDFQDFSQNIRLRRNISAYTSHKCRRFAGSYKCRESFQILHFNICARCKSLYICAFRQVYCCTKAANLHAEDNTTQEPRCQGELRMYTLESCAMMPASRVETGCRNWHGATCALTRHIQSNGKVAQRHNLI